MANSYTRTLVETTAAMSWIPKPAGALAKHSLNLSHVRLPLFGNAQCDWPLNRRPYSVSRQEFLRTSCSAGRLSSIDRLNARPP